jgi:hypothetical protein
LISPEETGFRGLTSTSEWLDKVTDGDPEGHLLPIAHNYAHFGWSQKCIGFWHGLTIARLVGVFLYRFVPKSPDIPEYHWIIVGSKFPFPDFNESWAQHKKKCASYNGLPNAYIWAGHPEFDDADAAPNPAAALDSYVGVIGAWIGAVRNGDDLTKMFPVEVPANKTPLEYADDIELLLKRIDAEILPSYAEDLRVGGNRRL